MKKKITIFSVLFLCSISLSLAQDKISEVKTKKKEKKFKIDSLENKNSIALTIGTGIGAIYSRKLSPKLYASFGYNSFIFSVRNIEQEVSGEDLLIDTDLDFRSLDFKLHYHPFGTSFKLIGGFGYFLSSNINIKTTFIDNIVIGDVEFNSNDSGNLLIDINWSEFAPFLGLGFGKLVKNKKFSLAIDFGTYISNSPLITLDATGIIEETKNQEELLNESFKSFKFIPFANLKIIYSF